MNINDLIAIVKKKLQNNFVIENISIEDKDTTTFVPVEATVTMDVHPYYTPHKLRKKFNLNTMASGQAYKDGFI